MKVRVLGVTDLVGPTSLGRQLYEMPRLLLRMLVSGVGFVLFWAQLGSMIAWLLD